MSQAAFARALAAPGTDLAGVSAPGGGAAGKRLDVYRNNVAVGLRAALATGFPVVAKLTGPAAFAALARAFIAKAPPETPVMQRYGAALPEFLDGYAPLARHGYLADVARLELALRRSYHAADAAPVDPGGFAALPADRLADARLRLAPAVALVRSRWPIHAIWRFNREPDAPKPAMAAEDVLILRPDFDPAPHLLGPGGAAFVAALLSGETLGAAQEAGRGEAPRFDAAFVLALLMRGGAIAAVAA